MDGGTSAEINHRANAGRVHFKTSLIAKKLYLGCKISLDLRIHPPNPFSAMTETQFLELACQRYQEIPALNELDAFYEHKKQFGCIMG